MSCSALLGGESDLNVNLSGREDQLLGDFHPFVERARCTDRIEFDLRRAD